MDPLGIIVLAQLVRNHFLASLPKRQQVGMVQHFGIFQ